jgi:hypothetical protein
MFMSMFNVHVSAWCPCPCLCQFPWKSPVGNLFFCIFIKLHAWNKNHQQKFPDSSTMIYTKLREVTRFFISMDRVYTQLGIAANRNCKYISLSAETWPTCYGTLRSESTVLIAEGKKNSGNHSAVNAMLHFFIRGVTFPLKNQFLHVQQRWMRMIQGCYTSFPQWLPQQAFYN